MLVKDDVLIYFQFEWYVQFSVTLLDLSYH